MISEKTGNQIGDIRRQINKNLNDDIKKELMYFSVLWNLFEMHCYYQNFKFCSKQSPSLTDELVNYLVKEGDHGILLNLVEDLKAYNKKYNHNTQTIYGQYQIRDSELSFNAFDQLYNSQAISDQIKVAILLSARVRNNMFHGLKCVSELNGQVTLFASINHFLEYILELNDIHI